MLFNQLLGYASNGSYAGIGSRKLTVHNSLLMAEFSFYMTLFGYHLNSGAADGSDTSCEWGAKIAYDLLADLGWVPNGEYDRVMSIYLPWSGFNGRDSSKQFISQVLPQAEQITKEYHPAWNNLSQAARKMMSRNCHQALGRDLKSFVDFVFCWTPDGASTIKQTSSKTGGTGQAIRISEAHGIKTLNFAYEAHYQILMKKLESARSIVLKEFGVDGQDYIKKKYIEHNPFQESSFTSFKELISQGVGNQILVHGANCQHKMASGFAKEVRDNYGAAYQADLQTARGSRAKLGTYSFANITLQNSHLSVINAYTQHRWGRDPNLHVDYDKTRKVFKSINADFPHGKIYLPKIGAGLANGCWITLSNIIKTEFKGRDVCLLKHKDEHLHLEELLKAKEKYSTTNINKKTKSNQMSLI